MMEQLIKAYEYFPRREGETERIISVVDRYHEFEIRMTIYINDKKYSASNVISDLEFENLKRTDVSDVMLKRVCRKFSDDFE